MIFSGKLSKLTAVKLLKLLIPNSAASQKLYSVFSPSMNDHCSRVVLSGVPAGVLELTSR